MTSSVDVPRELSRLRSFQRDTARYAFDRLFGEGGDCTSRFLVADEVGLGKTMVARGVIAQAIAHLQDSGDDRVDIVYICSNGAIAAQNLRKLAPTGVEVEHRTERLPLLAFKLSRREHRAINLVALTPGTSFHKGWATGQVEERAAVLRALQQLWGGRRLMGRGIGRIFAAGIGAGHHDSKEDRIREMAAHTGSLDDAALAHFGTRIALLDAQRAERGEPDLDTALHELAGIFARQDDPPRHAKEERNRLIGQLREALAMTGAHLLHPDVVVLDEFQRFREILHSAPGDRDYAAEVAHHLFDYHHADFDRRTRVLLLSATPYVMHTTRAEETAGSDDHYADFLATFRFLAHGLPDVDVEKETADLRADLSGMRLALLDAARDGVEPALQAADAVSRRLRKVMVRTERLAATPDRDGMLVELDERLPVPTPRALGQYMATAEVARYVAGSGVTVDGRRISASDVVEFWKAAPYTLSYLGAHTYKLALALAELAGPSVEAPDVDLLELLRHSPAVLPWDAMRHYEWVDPTHEGLRRLWSDFFDDAEAHRLLWLPPSLPYYRAGGLFETEAARRLTKRLVFSAWALVPTAIATLTSYECERRLHAAATAVGATTHDYDDERRNAQRIRFAGDNLNMAHLALLIPSRALADLGDPYADAIALRAAGVEPTLERVEGVVRDRVRAAVAPLVDGYPVGRGAGATSWYSLAPLLLEADEPLVDRLPEVDEDSVTSLGRHVHELEELRTLARTGGPDSLPSVPEDLVEILTLRTLAGPPSVVLRALNRLFPTVTERSLLAAAAAGAEVFRSLFNTPEAIQVIDAFDAPGDYWQKVLRYCAAGNLQAVVDEFFAVLFESRGYDRGEDREDAMWRLIEDFESVVGRPALYRPAAVTGSDDDAEPRWRQLRLRGRFALRFGNESSEEKAERRAEDIGLSFNSPFWPFVLASTSVGQEGLDFHQYSHAVTHWNLPPNPVDLEQREGRVHRYKGHAVRKNIARSVPFPTDGSRPPWPQLFDAACEADAAGASDMVPFWVYAPDSLNGEGARIERRLPLMPFTREASIVGTLRSSVAHYRLAFGQPRQEELVATLTEVTDPELRAALATVRVDLAPPRAHLPTNTERS